MQKDAPFRLMHLMEGIGYIVEEVVNERHSRYFFDQDKADAYLNDEKNIAKSIEEKALSFIAHPKALSFRVDPNENRINYTLTSSKGTEAIQKYYLKLYMMYDMLKSSTITSKDDILTFWEQCHPQHSRPGTHSQTISSEPKALQWMGHKLFDHFKNSQIGGPKEIIYLYDLLLEQF